MAHETGDPADGNASPDLHERAGAILLDAEGLSGEERSAFLHRACGDDSALLALVLSLDANVEAARGFLEDGPGRVLRRDLEQRLRRGGGDGTAAGHSLGPYRVVRRIAQGGMGTVYEAEQDAPRRRVALKVLAPGMGGTDVLRRFRREGELLARLSHPGIAKVLAVSEPGADEPWFAMELIDGLAITEHADAHGLGLRERLALLAETCDAVAHAHSRGIVHRDLKPPNVLVDSEGRPRVLDFGVARADALDAAGSRATRTGDLIGTLAYMSPEQAWGRHEQVDARTDVYALGVIGFELVTGRLPRDLDGLAIGEALHQLREGSVERADRARPELAGDVTVLLGKALASEPSERYASASELAADLRRCLRDEPIVARAPSARYRAAKFLRRHRRLAAVVGLAFALLTLTSVLAMRSAREARDAGELARAQAYRAGLAAATAAIERGHAHEARRLLDEAPPPLRGWEWRALRAETLDTAARVPLARVEALRFDGPDRLMATVPGDGEAKAFAIDLASDDGSPRPAGPAAAPAASPWAISPDGRLELAVDVGDVLVTERESGELRRSITLSDLPAGADGADGEAAQPGFTSAAFTADGEAMILASYGSPVLLHRFELATGAITATRSIEAQPTWRGDAWARGPATSRDAHGLVAWASDDGDVHVLDALLRHEVTTLHRLAPSRPRAMALSPDGSRLAAASGDSVEIFDLAVARLPREIAAHSHYVYAVAFDASGSRILTAGWDGRVRLRDAETLEEILAIAAPEDDPYVTDARFAAGDSLVVSVASGGSVQVVDAETGDVVARAVLPAGSGNHRLDVRGGGPAAGDGGGDRVAATRAGGGVAVLRLPGLELDRRFAGLERFAAWSPDGARLAAGTPDGAMLFEAGGSPVARLPALDASAGVVHRVRFSPDGELLLAAMAEGDVLVLEAATGRLRHRLRPGGGPCHDAVVSPDGRRIATGSHDGGVRVWDAASGGLLASWLAHDLYVHGVAFSPDGEVLVSVSGDRRLRRWDARSPVARRAALDARR